VNLLILDEPTNHLDVESCEALGEMLTEYSGTLFLVSHDRYLLNQVTNKTLGLTGRGTATWVVGNYSVWRASQGGGNEEIPSNAIPAKQQSRGAKPKAKK
jgi:ATPase subunit of ABC transporter with duplicated ATPase domains